MSTETFSKTVVTQQIKQSRLTREFAWLAEVDSWIDL